MTKQRLLIAGAVAPLIVPLGFVLFSFVIQDRSRAVFLAVPISVFLSYFGMLVFGLPLVYLLRRIGWLNLPMLVLSGALAGCIVIYGYPALLAVLLTDGPFDLHKIYMATVTFNWRLMLWGASLSVVVALVFGVIAGVPCKNTSNPQSVILRNSGNQRGQARKF